MTQKHINFGAFPDDINADAIRTAFSKTEDNFNQLFNGTILTGVTSLTAGDGLHTYQNNHTGPILISANIANINVTSSTLKVGKNSNIGSSATIANTSDVLILDLPETIPANVVVANTIIANVANATTINASNAVINLVTAPLANITSLTAGNSTVTGTAAAQILKSTVATGTAPLIVNSTTVVANLTAANSVYSINANNANTANFAVSANTANIALYSTTSNTANFADFASNSGFALNSANASLAASSTNLADGLVNQIPYQVNPSETDFIAAPTVSNTVLTWNGSGFVWAAVASSGTVANASGNAVYANFSGNANFSNTAQYANYVTEAIQSNITQVGNLTRINIQGPVNLNSIANIRITGGGANYMMITDGTGNLAWTAQPGTIAAGSLGAVQFNGPGNIAKADTGEYFMYDSPSHSLLMNGSNDGMTLSHTGIDVFNDVGGSSTGITSTNVPITVLGTGKFATANWAISEASGQLVFSKAGVPKVAMDDSGALTDISGAVSAPRANSVAWGNVTGKPSLSTVASTGMYSDLIAKPTLSTVASTGSYDDLINKPASLITSGWNVSEGTGGRLVFSYAGTPVISFGPDGNITTIANIISGGTP